MRILSLLPLLLVPLVAANLDPGDFAHFKPVTGNLTRRASPVVCSNGYSYNAARTGCVCNSPKYISADTVKCLPACSTGSFPDDSTRTCIACTPPATKCTSPIVATLCADGWYLYQDVCYQTCPLRTWANPTTSKSTCQPCKDPDAATCSSKGTKATSCTTKYLYKNQCIDETAIPPGLYADVPSHTTKSCDKYVATCVGPGSGGALTCAKNAAGDQYVLTSKGTCSLHCRSRQYADKSPGVAACVPCVDAAALKCDASGATQCGQFDGQQTFLASTKTCLLPSSGPPGFFADTNGNKFTACDDGVETCTGSGDGKANSCGLKSDRTALYFSPSSPSLGRRALDVITHLGRRDGADIPTGSCVVAASCPSGTYADAIHSTCTVCDEGEETCTGTGNGSATRCQSGKFLSSTNDCVSSDVCKASGAFYPDSGTRTCSECNYFARACTGGNIGQATACGKFFGEDQLFLYQGYCIFPDGCPSGTYPDPGTNVCEPCDPGALSCTGHVQATSCGKTSSKALLFLDDGKCVLAKDCDPSKWAYPATRHCEDCTILDPDAATCSSPATLTCSTTYFYQSSCVSECPDGLYGLNKQCVPCLDSSSTTCDSSGVATACKSPKLVWNGQCVDTCLGATYKEAGACKPCVGDFVASCDGSGSITCIDGYHQDGGTGDCVQDDAIWEEPTVEVPPCVSPASECDGDGATVACEEGYVLFNGDCTDSSSCLNNDPYYILESYTTPGNNNGFRCTLCDQEPSGSRTSCD